MSYKILARTKKAALNEHETELLRLYRFKELRSPAGRVFEKEGTIENLSGFKFYKKHLGRNFNLEVQKACE